MKIKRIKEISDKFVNLKVGVPLGAAMACFAAYSHYDYGLGTMALVGARHFVTSSLTGSLSARACQYGARNSNPFLGWTLGELYAWGVANAIILSAHYITGTPEPFKAIAIPSLIGAVILNPMIIYLTRTGRLK